MGAPAAPRKRMQLTVPQGAASFTIHRCFTETVRDRQGGRKERMKGPALPDGSVPDQWPIAEFSTAAVLNMWGAGKYRVDFYDSGGELIRGAHHIFEVAYPVGKQRSDRRLKPQTIGEPEGVLTPPAPSAPQATGGMGFFELMTLLREERQEAERRAELQRQSDREFWAQQQANTTQLIGTIMGHAPKAGADPDIIRREMQLSIERGLFEIKKQLTRQEEEEPDPEPSDGQDPPADLAEGVERIGLAFLSQIENSAPELMQEAVPMLVSWLEKRGLQPSAEMQHRIARMRGANGAGHANGD